jgi:hypothetical protein
MTNRLHDYLQFLIERMSQEDRHKHIDSDPEMKKTLEFWVKVTKDEVNFNAYERYQESIWERNSIESSYRKAVEEGLAEGIEIGLKYAKGIKNKN